MKKVFCVFMAMASAVAGVAQSLIPKPVSIVRGEGVATLVPYRTIEVSHSELEPLADYLSDYLPSG
ncbi:MAG: hypothetical protein LBR57_02245, partial [Alistipes sp.]|nr:hypothetical protein [Alistipes sp.]